MALNIEPYIGIGPIQFGMTVQEVREALKIPFTTFMKTRLDDHPTDAFDQLGLHVYYDRDGICEAVEGFATCQVEFQGVALVRTPYGKLVEWSRALDPGLDMDDTGFTSHLLGFGIYAPFGEKRPELVPEAVIVFRRNYYGLSE